MGEGGLLLTTDEKSFKNYCAQIPYDYASITPHGNNLKSVSCTRMALPFLHIQALETLFVDLVLV